MDKVLFKEEQQFRQWWQIVFILGSTVSVIIINIYTLYMQIVKGVQVGNSSAPNVVMVGVIFAMLIAIWVYFSMKLEVWIDQDGIHYRFFPRIIKNQFISKEEIQRFEIRKYNAVWDYGGRGIRKGFGRKWGRGYIVNGNIGLQLYLKNGKKILFGTQRSQAMMYAMDEMIKQKR